MRTQFAASDRRFGDMNNRFEDLTKYLDKRFTSLQWSLGGALVLLTTLISIYQFVAYLRQRASSARPLAAQCGSRRHRAGPHLQVCRAGAVSYTHLTLPTILRV